MAKKTRTTGGVPSAPLVPEGLRELHSLIVEDLPFILENLADRIKEGYDESMADVCTKMVSYVCKQSRVAHDKLYEFDEYFVAGHLRLCQFSQKVAVAEFRGHENASLHAAAAAWLDQQVDALCETLGFANVYELRESMEFAADDDTALVSQGLANPFGKWHEKYENIKGAEAAALKLEAVQSLLEWKSVPQSDRMEPVGANTSRISCVDAAFIASHEKVQPDVQFMAGLLAADRQLDEREAARKAEEKYKDRSAGGINFRFYRWKKRLLKPPSGA